MMNLAKRPSPLALKKILAFGILSLSISTQAWAGNINTPALKMFPKDVTSYIQETGQTASSMEKGIRAPIAEMEKNMDLYKATGCEGMDSDPGCTSIAKNIADNYSEMLNVMGDKLPQMRHTINKTNQALKTRIVNHMGKRMSPSDLQKSTGDLSKPKIRKGRYSLSKRFAQYSKLITSQSNGNLIDLASEMYLDSASVSDWIALMEGQIEQQKVLIDIGQMYGGVTPEMIGIIDSVKNVIFGEEVTANGGELSNPETISAQHDNDLIWRY